jgi:hypothetical protein
MLLIRQTWHDRLVGGGSACIIRLGWVVLRDAVQNQDLAENAIRHRSAWLNRIEKREVNAQIHLR